jgi:uncharacterized membrane protein
MNAILDICLDTTAILTIVCGVAGLLFSLSLVFFPERTQTIDEFLSRTYHLKERLAYFDQTIRNELLIYRNPVLSGCCFIAGSVVTLIFLFAQMDVERLLGILHIQDTQRLLWEMVLEGLVIAGKLAGVIGVIVGLFLIIAPGRLQRIENRLNSWVATQPIVDRLDVFNHVVNVFSFRHPILIGSIGILLSIILLTLSISSFF